MLQKIRREGLKNWDLVEAYVGDHVVGEDRVDNRLDAASMSMYITD